MRKIITAAHEFAGTSTSSATFILATIIGTLCFLDRGITTIVLITSFVALSAALGVTITGGGKATINRVFFYLLLTGITLLATTTWIQPLPYAWIPFIVLLGIWAVGILWFLRRDKMRFNFLACF